MLCISLDHLDKLHALCHDQSCRTDSFLHDGHFVCANHCISECRLCLLFLHVYHSADTLEYLDCAMSSTPSNYKSVHNNRFHGDEDRDPRSNISQGGGDDAVHPTIIPMYTLTTPQAPKGHTIRPRPYAMGRKVNSVLFEPTLSTHGTWLLPHAWTLHILRYNLDDHGGSKDQGQAWKRRRKKKNVERQDLPGSSGSPAGRSGPSPDDPDPHPDDPGNVPEDTRSLLDKAGSSGRSPGSSGPPTPGSSGPPSGSSGPRLRA